MSLAILFKEVYTKIIRLKARLVDDESQKLTGAISKTTKFLE